MDRAKLGDVLPLVNCNSPLARADTFQPRHDSLAFRFDDTYIYTMPVLVSELYTSFLRPCCPSSAAELRARYSKLLPTDVFILHEEAV